MSTPGQDALVGFLRRETGAHLHAVLQYDADSWWMLYRSVAAADLLVEDDADLDDLLDTFRREGRRNRTLQSVFGLGGYYCSLHLFDRLVLVHFFGADAGVIVGYDPRAASHLTDFVSLILPFVRDAGVDALDERPDWRST